MLLEVPSAQHVTTGLKSVTHGPTRPSMRKPLHVEVQYGVVRIRPAAGGSARLAGCLHVDALGTGASARTFSTFFSFSSVLGNAFSVSHCSSTSRVRTHHAPLPAAMHRPVAPDQHGDPRCLHLHHGRNVSCKKHDTLGAKHGVSCEHPSAVSATGVTNTDCSTSTLRVLRCSTYLPCSLGSMRYNGAHSNNGSRDEAARQQVEEGEYSAETKVQVAVVLQTHTGVHDGHTVAANTTHNTRATDRNTCRYSTQPLWRRRMRPSR